MANYKLSHKRDRSPIDRAHDQKMLTHVRIVILVVIASVVLCLSITFPSASRPSWHSYHNWDDYKAQHEAIRSGAAPPRFYQITTQPNGQNGGLGNKYIAHFSHLLAAMRSGRALITDDAPVWAALGIDSRSASVKSEAVQRELWARSKGRMWQWPFHRYVYQLLSRWTFKTLNWATLENLVCEDWPSKLMGDQVVVSDFEAFHGVPSVHLLLHPTFDDSPAGWRSDSGLRGLVQSIYQMQPWVQQRVQSLKAQTGCGVMGPHDIGVHMRVTSHIHWPHGQESASVFAAAVLSSPIACMRAKSCSIYVASDNYTNITPLRQILEHGTNHRVCWSPLQHDGEAEVEQPLSSECTLENAPSLLGLLEMAILSEARYIVSTRYSTFTMMAVAAGHSSAHAIVSPPGAAMLEKINHTLHVHGSWVHHAVSPFASQSLDKSEPHVWFKSDFGVERLEELSCSTQKKALKNRHLFKTKGSRSI